MKQVVITFTRHQLSTEQLDSAIIKGAEAKGLEPLELKQVKIIDFTELAKQDLTTDDQARFLADGIAAAILVHSIPNKSTVLGVFGVFPSPLLEWLGVTSAFDYTNFFSAWNATRTPEGGKPTFQFKRWCKLPLK